VAFKEGNLQKDERVGSNGPSLQKPICHETQKGAKILACFDDGSSAIITDQHALGFDSGPIYNWLVHRADRRAAKLLELVRFLLNFRP